MSSTACAVCSSASTKYKCSKCHDRTCCLDCYKNHEAGHAGDPVSKTLVDQQLPTECKDSSDQQDQKQQSGNPLQEFAESSELRELLVTQPELVEMLHSIYSMVKSTPASGGAGVQSGARSRRRMPWTRPENLERGLDELKSVLSGDGPASDALRRFIDLVNKQYTSLPAEVPLER